MNVKKSKIFYLFIFVFFFLIGAKYNPNSTFDLYRYYEFANNIDVNEDFIDYLLQVHLNNFDFIYFSTFFAAKLFNIPKGTINGLFLSVYYISICLIILEYSKNADIKKTSAIYAIILFCILSLPIIYSLSISRTIAALSFAFLGVYFNIVRFRYASFAFLILCLATHIGMIFFIAPLFLILKTVKPFTAKKSHKIIFVMLLMGALFSNYWIDAILNAVKEIPFFVAYARYSEYIDVSTSIYKDLAYYDLVPTFIFLVTGLILFIKITEHNNYTVSAGFLLLFFASSLHYSTMFTQRAMMVSVPFMGVLLLESIHNLRLKYRLTFVCVTTIPIAISFLINILGYRAYLLDSFI